MVHGRDCNLMLDSWSLRWIGLNMNVVGALMSMENLLGRLRCFELLAMTARSSSSVSIHCSRIVGTFSVYDRSSQISNSTCLLIHDERNSTLNQSFECNCVSKAKSLA